MLTYIIRYDKFILILILYVISRETREIPDHQDLQHTSVTWERLFKVRGHRIQSTIVADQQQH